MKRNRTRRIIFLFLVIGPLAVFIVGGLTMLLWNNVLVPVLHVSSVTFWQALGILVLAKILFSSFAGRGRPRRFFQKQRMMWEGMTPEQREKFKQEWRDRCRRWGNQPDDIGMPAE